MPNPAQRELFVDVGGEAGTAGSAPVPKVGREARPPTDVPSAERRTVAHPQLTTGAPDARVVPLEYKHSYGQSDNGFLQFFVLFDLRRGIEFDT